MRKTRYELILQTEELKQALQVLRCLGGTLISRGLGNETPDLTVARHAS